MPPTSAEIYIGLFHRVLDAARLSREGGTGGGRAGGEAVMIKLLPHFDAYYEAVACDGSVLYLRTNKDAPLYKLVSVDLTHRLSREAAGGACGAGVREVVAEQKDLLLGVQQVSCKYFVALYMLQGMSQSLPEEQEASLQGDHARCCAPWCKNRRRRRVVDAPRAPLRPQSTEPVGTGEMACCHALEILSMAGRRLKRVDLPDFASITEIRSVRCSPHLPILVLDSAQELLFGFRISGLGYTQISFVQSTLAPDASVARQCWHRRAILCTLKTLISASLTARRNLLLYVCVIINYLQEVATPVLSEAVLRQIGSACE